MKIHKNSKLLCMRNIFFKKVLVVRNIFIIFAPTK